MRVRFWGVRGSISVPGPATSRFGGNTSCVQVTTPEAEVILDAGSGIRALGAAVATERPLHILLSHLHIDHIHGLLFFAPFFNPSKEITVWGPPEFDRRLRGRLGRFMSDPLSPIEIRDLPARVVFRDAPFSSWRIEDLEVEAALVAHRGTTLGFRLTTNDTSLCYLPDHEPSLGQDLTKASERWISGGGLARDVSLLIHDCQYADSEYRAHRGWGHSCLSDTLTFARRCAVDRLSLFHHDPGHDDKHLSALEEEAAERWMSIGGAGNVRLAREGDVIELADDSNGSRLVKE
jgi:phosphoribosyl 1,2-cyclic phosphodiesterase